MTSTPTSTLPEDQLLELLVQLQKTTPDQARAILNAQPAIGYALVPLMAKLGILNLDVLQKTLATYAGQTVPQAPAPAPPPVPTIPAHLTQIPPYGHQPTPPPAVQNPYAVPPGQPAAPVASGYPGYPPQAQPQPQPQNGVAASGYPSQYGGQYQQHQQHQNHQQQQQHQQQQAPAPGLAALANIPDDQKEMIMRVVSMTPEQMRALSPAERAITLQLEMLMSKLACDAWVADGMRMDWEDEDMQDEDEDESHWLGDDDDEEFAWLPA